MKRKKVAGGSVYSARRVDAAASFVLLVGLALGAVIVAGVGRIVGWGVCP